MRAAAAIFGFIPSVWPVVQRELRARARKPRYYWMRVLGGIAAMSVIYNILRDSNSPSATSTKAFGNLSLLILTLIVTTVPAMASDCLSREKREGTLGLLFLTPLTPAGIVIGKTVAQALLAWSMWLSVLPAMAIPLLLGGLTWKNIVAAVVVQFCAVLVSLASGLLASCFTQKRNLALFFAAALTFIFASLTLSLVYALGFMLATSKGRIASIAFNNLLSDLQWHGFSIISMGLDELIYLQTRQFSGSRLPFSAIFPSTSILLPAISCAAVLTVAAAIWLAARHIRKTWSDKPASARQQWWTQRFCTVLFQNAFRRKMQRSLDANPIAWLQQYSWKARITKWGLCLLFILIELWALAGESHILESMDLIIMPLLLILATVGTVAGVGSFHSEKESGALELILTTPLTVNAIIFGRVLGWWKQFLPAAIIFLLFVGAANWANSWIFNPAKVIWIFCFFATAYLSLPFFAVYAALRIKYFAVAVALAISGLALEFFFGLSLAHLLTGFEPTNTTLVLICTALSSAAIVRLTFFLLRHSLSLRIYSF